MNEWLDDLGVVELDSEKLRALAHPIRSRIVSSLRIDGPATSTVLANRLATNSGQTSYHLRVLAKAGLVVEDAGRGTARERWWKAAQRGHSWTETELAPDDRHAADWLLWQSYRMYTHWVSAWFELRESWPEAWRRATTTGDSFFMADPELLLQMRDDLVALLDRYRVLGRNLNPDDPDVHRVVVVYHAFPSDHIRP